MNSKIEEYSNGDYVLVKKESEINGNIIRYFKKNEISNANIFAIEKGLDIYKIMTNSIENGIKGIMINKVNSFIIYDNLSNEIEVYTDNNTLENRSICYYNNEKIKDGIYKSYKNLFTGKYDRLKIGLSATEIININEFEIVDGEIFGFMTH